MSKLEELKAQVNALQKEIRDLERETTICGCAKYDRDYTPPRHTRRPPKYYRIGVYKNCIVTDELGHNKRMTVIIEHENFDICLEKLDQVINDLTALKVELKS